MTIIILTSFCMLVLNEPAETIQQQLYLVIGEGEVIVVREDEVQSRRLQPPVVVWQCENHNYEHIHCICT